MKQLLTETLRFCGYNARLHNLTAHRLTPLFLSAILLCSTSQLLAIDYYVHPVTGDDANTGTDIRTPWKTLEKASSAPLKPGDRVLLAGGQTFKGQLLFQGLAGTPQKPITFSSYQPQLPASSEPRATIDGRGYLAALQLSDCKHITVANLILTADGGGLPGNSPKKADMRCGLLVKAEADGDYAGVSLTNLLVRDVSFEERGFVRPQSDVNTANGTARYGWGIRFIAETPRALLRDIAVMDCQITHVDHTGLKFTAPSNGVQNVRAERITVLNSGGPGIQMSGVSGGHFSHLYVNGSGSTNDTRNWGRGSGLWTWSTRDVVIEKSQFLNANGPGDSAGVHIDYHCRNVVVQYNLSANNAGGFCEILGNNYNCAYRYNVSVNDGHRVKGEKGAFQEGKTFWLSGYVGGKNRRGPFNSYFYNNTIYLSSNIVSKVAVAPTTEGVLIANNIFYIQGKSLLVIGDQSRADSGKVKQLKNILFENNLYLRADNWPRDVLIQDRAPRIGNPAFRNPGGFTIADYIPRNEKAVKNQGILIQKIPEDTIGLTIGLKLERDILGNPILNGPDMGAIEIR
jgi:hypothetical protein